MFDRVFLVVLDSLGIGEMDDAELYGDKGSHTLKALTKSEKLEIPTLASLGLYNIPVAGLTEKAVKKPLGAYGAFDELSKGKDTTVGHWEICGVVSEKPLPTYPDGFPKELLDEFSSRVGRGWLCNKPYSGTEVIKDYGKEHIETGKLIIYTSADSVFQIAAHEKYVSVEELYQCCETAREMLKGEHGVGRVIARPFDGEIGSFFRTGNRHDYSLPAPEETVLDILKAEEKDIISVGKIKDIFAGRGITEAVAASNNKIGQEKLLELADRDFNGLCFVNLVDFDSVYGHRNDVDGYASALTDFDKTLKIFLEKMRENDLLLITSDHGCDPATPSTDHSRERTFLLAAGKKIVPADIGLRNGFCDIAATVAEALNARKPKNGKSFLNLITEE